jgi:hypothetical protein
MRIDWLLYTILVIPAFGFMMRFFFQMIEPGGALDVVFGWQKMLDKLYRGGKVSKLLEKALGGCKLCCTFWMAVPYFFAYWAFSRILFDYYPTDGMVWWKAIAFHVFWYVVIHVLVAGVGFAILTAKNKKEKK